MRQKRDKILIVALSSLVLFTSSLSLMMYIKSKKQKLQPAKQEVVVYVAKTNLKKGTLLTYKDIQKRVFPKNYILFSPLIPEEIIGKYTKIDLSANEPFRRDELTLHKNIKESVSDLNSKNNNTIKISNDSVSLSLDIFRNIDYTIKSGDYIDIACTRENSKNDFKTVYVALHIKIISFFRNGLPQKAYHDFVVTKDGKKKAVADTIVLDMSPQDIKNLLTAYYTTQKLNARRVFVDKNRSGQLWMIKTKIKINPKIESEKSRLLINRKIYKRRKVFKRKVVISYEK